MKKKKVDFSVCGGGGGGLQTRQPNSVIVLA